MPELWDQLTQQPVAEPPSLWPQGDRAPLRITVGGPTMKDGAQVSPGSSLDPFNPPQVQYVGTPLANTLWSALKEMGVKGQRLLSGLQQYSGEQFPASTGTQTMSTDTEPVKQAVENMDPMLANLWGIGSASVPRGAVGAIGSSPFYSAAQRAVENAKLGKGTPEQWLGYLRNQPGVKAEELDRVFGNLPQQGMLTKPQMQAHAAENAVTLGEVNKSDIATLAHDVGAQRVEPIGQHGLQYLRTSQDIADAMRHNPQFRASVQGMSEADIFAAAERLREAQKYTPTKYSQWQLPGGENYREKLLTLPKKPVDIGPAPELLTELPKGPDWENSYRVLRYGGDGPEREWGVIPPGQSHARAMAGQHPTEAEAVRQALNHINARNAQQYDQALHDANKSDQFTSSHWAEPNVLAHIRMNDRQIPGVGKSLHAEEFQSDMHQQGRLKGYRNELTPAETTERHDIYSLPEKVRTPEQQARMEELDARVRPGSVPDAPFKSTWADLSLKRLIREASEKGYDAISWTPGEAQAARYDLSKHISDVELHGTGDNLRLSAFDKNGRSVIDMQHTTPQGLADHIGKEAAEKLLSQPEPNLQKNPYAARRLTNADLKVGGEGMKAFYDKMLVDKANALGKKHGARVEQNEIETPRRATDWAKHGGPDTEKNPVHVLRITPQLREAAMKGFPLFSAGAMLAPGLFGEQRQ